MVAAGLAVLPTHVPGDKHDHKGPKFMEGGRRYGWKSSPAPKTAAQIEQLFGERAEVGIICGVPSGNLECLDFDREDAFPAWLQLVKDHCGDEALAKCYAEKTPSGGVHVVYRLPGAVLGNRQFAKDATGKKAIIETRGEGGYFKCWPSVGYTAILGKINRIGVLAEEEYELFVTLARVLNEHVSVEDRATVPAAAGGNRPGDDFDRRATWEEILEPHGWRVTGKTTLGRRTWTRPGKDSGPSASTENKPSDHLWVYSSSTEFVAGRAYSKFTAYKVLNHRGDVVAAASALVKAGYGEQRAPREASGFGHVETPLSEVKANRVARFKGPAAVWATDVEIEDPRYVWEPYLLRSNIQIVDGRGGSRKSTLIMMLAACLSRGKTPYGEDCEPVKTFFFGLEDALGAYRSVFDRAGGDSRLLKLCGEGFGLCNGGAEWLAHECNEEGFGLVVLDPFKAFLEDIRSEIDTLQVTGAFNKIRPWAAKTEAAWVGISHWAKGASLTDMTKAHAGAEAWRNSSRGMLSVAKHPEQPSLSCVHHTKASIQTPEGEPFAFESTGGQLYWVPKDQVDWSVFKEKKKGFGGGNEGQEPEPRHPLTDGQRLLHSLLSDGVEYVGRIREIFLQAGFSSASLYRAKDGLGDLIIEGLVPVRGEKPAKTWRLRTAEDDIQPSLLQDDDDDPFAMD